MLIISKFRPCLLFVLLVAVCGLACKRTNDPGKFTIGYWTIDMTTANRIPGDTSATDHADGVLNLMTDSSLYFDLYFTKLSSGDAANSIALYYGKPADTGKLLTTFSNVTFDGQNKAIGSFKPGATVIDSLLSTTGQFFLVIGSTKYPAGLVRGQLGTAGSKISFARDVALSGASVNPPVSTTATGLATLRLMSDNVTMYYNVAVSNIPAGDSLTGAYIRKTADNSILIQLAAAAADFNTIKSISVSSPAAFSLVSDPLYIDVRSRLYPNGLIRGTLR